MSKKPRETTVIIGEERANNGKVYKTIIDKETGELIKGYWVEEKDTPTGRPPGKRAHFLKIYRTNWLDIVIRKHLSPYEAGVFSLLITFLDWKSPYIVHPNTGKNLNESELADLLKIDRAQLNSTIQSLCDKGMLKKVYGGKGRPNHFMINTNIAFYGNTIKDLNDHTTFIKDCTYKPAVEIKYKQSQQK
jgi:hypothetical protein